MLRYDSLDQTVRQFMLEELTMDVASGSLYMSPRLSAYVRGIIPACWKNRSAITTIAGSIASFGGVVASMLLSSVARKAAATAS